MTLTLQDVGIGGLSVVTGSIRVRLDDEVDSAYQGDAARVARLKQATGLDTRRVVKAGTTALDLGLEATQRLMEQIPEARQTQALIFVTQTPDHFQPCNAALLHGRLQLSKQVAAWDVNLGCSGWVYGVSQAAAWVSAGGLERVLVVTGDTLSQQLHPGDRSTVPLFGDAASATLVKKSPGQQMPVLLGTDGGGAGAIQVPAGGFREPADAAAQQPHTDAEGNLRRRTDLHLDGPEVFKFTLREVPVAVNELLAAVDLKPQQVSRYYFHQANGFILDNLRRRLKIPAEAVPKAALAQFGNLSSASIPSAICLDQQTAQSQASSPFRALCCGFGVGLSWGALLTEISPEVCLPVVTFSGSPNEPLNTNEND
jgi:3-oxoacyl-[acyl-carrier-protein] synthase-3